MQQTQTKYSLKYILTKLLGGKVNKEKPTKYSHKKEGFIIRFHRKLAKPVVDWIYPISFITPNQITWLGFILACLSALLIAISRNNYIYLILASLLFWLSAIMDCIDGQLARMRKSSSDKGEWLDSILEIGKGFFFWIGVGFNLSTFKSQILGFNIWFLITINLTFLSFLTFMSIYSSWLFKESQPVSHGHVYFAIFVILFKLLELTLILFIIVTILSTVYMLIEKSLLLSNSTQDQKPTSSTSEWNTQEEINAN